MARVRYIIDLRQLRENFAALQRCAGDCQLMPVLKYDAYGMGALKIGETLKSAGAARFAGATLDEGMQLQKLGLPVQILGLLPDDEIPEVVNAGIIAPVANMATAQKLSREACRQQKSVRIAVKLDTGMGRAGLQVEKAAAEIAEIVKLPGLEKDSLFSHFANAAEPDRDFSALQIKRFCTVYEQLRQKEIVFPHYHHAAGDAIVNLPQAVQAPFNMARPGGRMYGSDFSGTCRQIVELQTVIGDIRDIPADGSINYFRTFIAQKPMKVAVLAAGYADGIPLALSNRGQVLIAGQECPVLGRVTMDYTVVDISRVPGAKVGDPVILLGRSGGREITVESWGKLKGTHSHEIWCSIGNRAVREYAE